VAARGGCKPGSLTHSASPSSSSILIPRC
jgi:hypothetical protein